MSACEPKIKEQPRGDPAAAAVVRASGWQGTPSHQTEGSQGGRGTGGLPPTQTWGQPRGQEHLPPGAWPSPAREPRAPLELLEAQRSPPNKHLPSASLPPHPPLPPASSSKSSVVISFFFINIIYKDGSSKKAKMRRLGGRGSRLRSCLPGWGCWRSTISLLISAPPHRTPTQPEPIPVSLSSRRTGRYIQEERAT